MKTIKERNSALVDKRRKKWEAQYTQVSHLCFTKAATGRCTYIRDWEIWNDRKLHLDHATCWKDKKTGEVVILNQPYGLGPNDLIEMLAACNKYGLEMHMDSWYNWWNDYTVAVLLKKKSSQDNIIKEVRL